MPLDTTFHPSCELTPWLGLVGGLVWPLLLGSHFANDLSFWVPQRPGWESLKKAEWSKPHRSQESRVGSAQNSKVIGWDSTRVGSGRQPMAKREFSNELNEESTPEPLWLRPMVQ